jgi:hypothetical protein
MATIPPAGMAPSLPPTPARRARRAFGLALAGLGLFGLALWWALVAHAPSELAREQGIPDFAAFARRLLFVVSAALHIAAVGSAWKARREERALAVAALGLSACWLGGVVWTFVRLL